MPKPVNFKRGADVDGGRAPARARDADHDAEATPDATAAASTKAAVTAASAHERTPFATALGNDIEPTLAIESSGWTPSASIRHVRRWIDGLGVRLWPARCLVCREAGDGGRDLCAGCAAALPYNRSACDRCAMPLPAAVAFDGRPLETEQTCGDCLTAPPPVTSTHATFVYGAPIDALLPRFKFHQDLAAGRLLGQLMLPTLTALARPDALVVLPLHRERLRQRGYDQALELARPLARALDLPLHADLLLRTRATAQQSRLDAAQRRRNVRGAFQVDRRAAGTAGLPSHVALVDDVMTTGATLHAAAEALRRAGVTRVDAWVCARVP